MDGIPCQSAPPLVLSLARCLLLAAAAAVFLLMSPHTLCRALKANSPTAQIERRMCRYFAASPSHPLPLQSMCAPLRHQSASIATCLQQSRKSSLAEAILRSCSAIVLEEEHRSRDELLSESQRLAHGPVLNCLRLHTVGSCLLAALCCCTQAERQRQRSWSVSLSQSLSRPLSPPINRPHNTTHTTAHFPLRPNASVALRFLCAYIRIAREAH